MTGEAKTPQLLEPLPVALLYQPLDYIQADHLRQRVMCSLCEELAAQRQPSADVIRQLIAFIETELQVHIVDEEHDFFPLLRRRCEASDDVEPILGQLAGDHETDERLAATLVEGLRSFLDHERTALPAPVAETLRAFAKNERQHLALENATVMPLARRRLTVSDQRDLASRMAARRGIVLERRTP